MLEFEPMSRWFYQKEKGSEEHLGLPYKIQTQIALHPAKTSIVRYITFHYIALFVFIV